jgi:hypothetical protein
VDWNQLIQIYGIYLHESRNSYSTEYSWIYFPRTLYGYFTCVTSPLEMQYCIFIYCLFNDAISNLDYIACENCRLLGCGTMKTAVKLPALQRSLLPLSSGRWESRAVASPVTLRLTDSLCVEPQVGPKTRLKVKGLTVRQCCRVATFLTRGQFCHFRFQVCTCVHFTYVLILILAMDGRVSIPDRGRGFIL